MLSCLKGVCGRIESRSGLQETSLPGFCFKNSKPIEEIMLGVPEGWSREILKERPKPGSVEIRERKRGQWAPWERAAPPAPCRPRRTAAWPPGSTGFLCPEAAEGMDPQGPRTIWTVGVSG